MAARSFFTIPELAARNGVTERRADYTARKLKLQPCSRIGIIRLFDETAARTLAEGLKEISDAREVTAHA